MNRERQLAGLFNALRNCCELLGYPDPAATACYYRNRLGRDCAQGYDYDVVDNKPHTEPDYRITVRHILQRDIIEGH